MLCLTETMTDLPRELRIRDIVLDLITDGDEVACWSGELPRDEHSMVSVVVEPAASPSREARETAEGVIGGFDELVEVATAYLVEELPGAGRQLTDADRGRLSEPPSPFGMPEATVWDDGTWLLRFAEADLDLAGDLGLAVRFVGTAPVAVDDLSDAEEDDPGSGSE